MRQGGNRSQIAEKGNSVNSQEYRNQPSGQPQEQAFSQSPAKPTITQTEVPEDSKDKPYGDQATAREMRRHFKWFEVISLVVNGCLAIIAVVALSIYSGQLEVMQGTLTEMKRSGQVATDQMWQAISNLNWEATSIQQTANAAATMSEQSVASARMEQRAWLTAKLPESPIIDGQPFKQRIELYNYGKSPMFNVHGDVVTVAVSENWKPRFGYSHGTFIDSNFVLPNEPAPAFSTLVHEGVAPAASPAPVVISPELHAKIRSGAYVIVTYGKIGYDDIFAQHHWLTFCAGDLNRIQNMKWGQACSQYMGTDQIRSH
jgi:hypothetical protein